MKRPTSLSTPIVVVTISLLLSLMSGFGQIKGFFGRVSVATVVASLVIAAVILLFFPDLLRREADRVAPTHFTPRQLSVTLAVLVLLFGAAPFVTKLGLAAHAQSVGVRFMDRSQHAPARVYLAQSARFFDDLGLAGRALRPKIALAEAEAALGETARANDLIGQVEQSSSLTVELQGALDVARGNLAYTRGEFEQAERSYQAAHQSIRSGSRDEAALLMNEGALWSERGVEHRQRAADNYRAAKKIYAALGDEVGLVQVSLNDANLYADDPREAIPRLESALENATRAGDPLLIGTIELNLGKVMRAQSRFADAEDHFKRARTGFEAAADVVALAELSISQSLLESTRGRNEAARQYLNQASAYLQNVEHARGGVTNVRKVAQLTVDQADLEDALGASDSAEKHYRDAFALYASAPDAAAEAAARLNYGALLLRLNRGQEAEQELRRGRELMRPQAHRGTLAIGALHNNIGIAFQNSGAFADARAEFEIAATLFDSLGARLEATEEMENLALLDAFEGKTDSVSLRLERAAAVYDSLGHYDRQVKSLFNLLAIYTDVNDPRAKLQLPRIMRILKEREVDQETESTILFGLLPQDFQRADLPSFRERIQHLYDFYDKSKEPVGLGLSLLQLARIEQRLGNQARARSYAERAEPYAEQIRLPLRIKVHTDLGFFLSDPDPTRGLDHFWRAFDLSEGTDVKMRLDLLEAIGAQLPSLRGSARDAQRVKLQAVAQSTDTSISKKAKRLLQSL